MKAKSYTIRIIRRGRERETEGTLAELTQYFGYTLLCGNSWNSRISLKPRTAKALVSSLNRSKNETQRGCYDRDYYELVE